ncbi:MAG: DUF1801 domain-containing protein [Flavobacteriales bacterium]|nr:DUF1801 domain-containing protein [Flavobacteriales bacterium]MBK6891756.1 DUF1801 domain-containing protein [Flavobacteriales bacterium]MBK7247677.1 DUF1801 domain-containing protein [Flavobacteriales bacterium]MBK7286627.1 DUF1801 domain-containing protein [Flavobacteriales bacterium]MBK9060489.1 DUF1801 domain-containing protein [Flavobacteriales bacterium]
MKPSAKNTDEYLTMLPDDQTKALQKLRKQILSAAPKCEEYFGYGLPGFRYNGHPLLYMGAAKTHCALYGMMPKGFDAELKDFKVSKGTIRFTPEKPLPAALVKAIVMAKVEAMNAKYPVKTQAKPNKGFTAS